MRPGRVIKRPVQWEICLFYMRPGRVIIRPVQWEICLIYMCPGRIAKRLITVLCAFFNLLLPPKLQTPSFAAQIIPQKKTPFPALRARDTLIAVRYPTYIYNPVTRPVKYCRSLFLFLFGIIRPVTLKTVWYPTPIYNLVRHPALPKIHLVYMGTGCVTGL